MQIKAGLSQRSAMTLDAPDAYACVVSKHHVVEPFHLSDADAAAF